MNLELLEIKALPPPFLGLIVTLACLLQRVARVLNLFGAILLLRIRHRRQCALAIYYLLSQETLLVASQHHDNQILRIPFDDLLHESEAKALRGSSYE